MNPSKCFTVCCLRYRLPPQHVRSYSTLWI
ncbi:MAG: (2Fe-2S)-binding protein [Lachnospiraceae bacterium]|nr:(2Fe-2S)-binding protein [Lachnospiraceae bacterium]